MRRDARHYPARFAACATAITIAVIVIATSVVVIIIAFVCSVASAKKKKKCWKPISNFLSTFPLLTLSP